MTIWREYQEVEETLRVLRNIQASRPDLDGSFLRNVISAVLAKKENAEKKLHNFPDSSPEAFIAISLLELRHYKRSLDEGGLVKTPWVLKTKDRIKEVPASLRPVFFIWRNWDWQNRNC